MDFTTGIGKEVLKIIFKIKQHIYFISLKSEFHTSSLHALELDGSI